MGLWEFLQQWRPSRVTVGVAASIFLHLAVVAIILWGGLIIPSREKAKKGDALIVELPKADEPAPAGTFPVRRSPHRRRRPGRAHRRAPRSLLRHRRRSSGPPPRRKSVGSRARRGRRRQHRPLRGRPSRHRASPRRKSPGRLLPEPAPKVAEPTPSPAEKAPAGPPAAPAPQRPPAEQQVARLPPAGPAPGPPAPDMRTALRRGAGGTGLQGRGGIEGEPIRLDSEDPRYNDYLEQIRRRIKAKWGYPCIQAERSCEYKEATLDIEFGILKDGRVQFVDIVHASDYRDLRPVRGHRDQAGVPISAGASGHAERGEAGQRRGADPGALRLLHRRSPRSPTCCADSRNCCKSGPLA